jgi:hypothetical protein
MIKLVNGIPEKLVEMDEKVTIIATPEITSKLLTNATVIDY